MNMPSKIEISYKTIVFTVFFLISLAVLYQIRNIILLVFIAFILTSALKPYTDFLSKYRIPRSISVIIVYLIFVALLVLIGTSLTPPLIAQSVRLGENLPGYLASISPYVQLDYQLLISQVSPLGENLLKMTFGVFGDIFTVMTVFVVSFYFVLERKNMESHLNHFMGVAGTRKLLGIIRNVEDRLGSWVRGEAALMLLIGILTAIGLLILNIPYVLPLAIIAGLLEIVPTIGPILSAIPAILIALTISPLLAVMTAVMYFLVQQLENNLFVPIIMKKVVGVSPLITIIALLVGAELAGIVGAVLAVPFLLTIETVFAEYTKLK
jgi:predicted PurR-regulated permease PerM